MLLLGMITGLNPMASASLRPAVAVVPVVLALAHHDGRNLAGASRALLLRYLLATSLWHSNAVPLGEHRAVPHRRSLSPHLIGQ
jgi:hypothetical protein